MHKCMQELQSDWCSNAKRSTRHFSILIARLTIKGTTGLNSVISRFHIKGTVANRGYACTLFFESVHLSRTKIYLTFVYNVLEQLNKYEFTISTCLSLQRPFHGKCRKFNNQHVNKNESKDINVYLKQKKIVFGRNVGAFLPCF